MDEIEVTKDGEFYIVKMPASSFASFAYWLLKDGRTENGDTKKKRGRPAKDSEQGDSNV
jgi:hypothetical protein